MTELSSDTWHYTYVPQSLSPQYWSSETCFLIIFVEWHNVWPKHSRESFETIVTYCFLFHLSSVSFRIGRGEYVSLVCCTLLTWICHYSHLDSHSFLCLTNLFPCLICSSIVTHCCSEIFKFTNFFYIFTKLELAWVVALNKTFCNVSSCWWWDPPSQLSPIAYPLFFASGVALIEICHSGPLNLLASPLSSPDFIVSTLCCISKDPVNSFK